MEGEFTNPIEPLSPPIYEKYQKGTTPALRFDKTYLGGGKEEFEALSRLYAVAPDAVARPIDLINDDAGNVVGFQMERIAGTSLQDFLTTHKYKIPKDIVAQVETAIHRIHQGKLAHGDINAQNILLTPERKIKIVDPVGYGNLTKEELDQFQELDLKTFKESIGDFEE